MHVHSDVEIDIDKISVGLILPMGGNCSKSLSFSKSKILLNFTTLDFHRLDPLFAKLMDPPPFLVILLICKYKNFPCPDPNPLPNSRMERAVLCVA